MLLSQTSAVTTPRRCAHISAHWLHCPDSLSDILSKHVDAISANL